MKIAKEEAQAILWEESDSKGKVILDEITGTSRWSIRHRLVFEMEGKFYLTKYSIAATEVQDEQPFENSDEVECQEVEKYERTVVDYRPVQ